MKQEESYTYTAYTPQQSGVELVHVGTLAGAIQAAKKYAREAFPTWIYEGYGPTIVVCDAEGETELHRSRL